MDSIPSDVVYAAEQEFRLRSSFDEDRGRLGTTLTKSRILIDRLSDGGSRTHGLPSPSHSSRMLFTMRKTSSTTSTIRISSKRSRPSKASMPANRQTSSLVDKSIVYGRNDELEKVIKLLGVPRVNNIENDIESVSVPTKRRKKVNV